MATGIGGPGARDLKIAMILNNNGQAITLAKDFAAAGYGDLSGGERDAGRGRHADARDDLPRRHPRHCGCATGCSAAASTLDDVKIIPIPPPQMVQNMKVGNMDGYCVGEPWDAVAVKQGIGFTHLATQDLWEHHPEKALVVNEQFATERTDV